MNRFSEKQWNVFIFLGLFFLPHFLYSFLFETPPGNDFSIYQPRALLRFFATLQAGCLPLWSPLVYGGMSAHFEHMLSQSFSPVTWLYALFPGTWSGSLIQVMLHFKLFFLGCGGIWAYLFFYRLSKARIPSLFGALTFMFNFRMLDNLRYATPLEILALLPLLLLLIEGWLQEKSAWRYWLYPLVLGAMLLSGHPQHSLYNLIFVSVYFLSRLFFLTPATLDCLSWIRRIPFQKMVAFSGMNLLGILLASPLLLPFQTDVIPQLYRRVMEDSARGDLHQMNLSSLIASFLFPWLADVHSNFYSFLGICFFLFVALQVVFKRLETSREQRFFLIFFLAFFMFTLLYALGSSAYVSTLVSEFIPPLKSTRVHGRILGTGVFCLSGIVVFVLHWIDSRSSLTKIPQVLPYRKFGIYFIGGSILGFISLFSLVTVVAWRDDFFGMQTIALSSKAFYDFLGGYFTYFILQSDSPAFIHASPSMFLWQMISFFVFASLTLITFYFLLSGVSEKKQKALFLLFFLILCETRFYHARGTWIDPAFPRQLSSHEFLAWDTFHQRFFPAMEYASPTVNETSQFHLQKQVADFNAPKAIALFLLSGGKPAFEFFSNLTHGKLVVTSRYSVVTDIATALARNKEDLRDRCFLEIEEAQKIPWKELFPEMHQITPGEYRSSNVQAGFQVLSYSPNGITFRMKMATPGLVNYLDAYHPQFVATVDGISVPCIRTYGVFKGVWVPQGIHEVSILYRPKSFFDALKLFWIALFCVVIGSLNAGMTSQQFSRKRKLLLLMFGVAFFFFVGGAMEKEMRRWVENPVLMQYQTK